MAQQLLVCVNLLALAPAFEQHQLFEVDQNLVFRVKLANMTAHETLVLSSLDSTCCLFVFFQTGLAVNVAAAGALKHLWLHLQARRAGDGRQIFNLVIQIYLAVTKLVVLH